MAGAIGVSARFEPLDVTEEESWAAVVAAAIRHFGKLDVLVNNAGVSGSAEQDFYSTEAWHRIMAVNATGVFFGIKYAVPAMIANGGGSIVNCRRLPASSAASTSTWPTTPRKRLFEFRSATAHRDRGCVKTLKSQQPGELFSLLPFFRSRPPPYSS